MNIAPILLFTYKRLDTLKQTVAALQKNSLSAQSDLYVFSDAAKKEPDQQAVSDVRDFLKTINGFKSIRIIAREQNFGLAKSIISGTSMVLETHDSVIVMEDDLLTTSNFLAFMNEALIRYKDDKKVFSISGYSFDLRADCSNYSLDAYFLNRGWSWGWATWRDRWINVDWNVSTYAEFTADKKAQQAFARGGSDLNKMLREQMEGRLDSWAIRWFYHQFKTGGVTLYPVYSKVYNSGFDEFATHTTGSEKRYVPALDKDGKTSFVFPDAIEATHYFQKMFLQKMGITARVRSKLHTIFLNMFKRTT
ncbi:hypothetical protein DC498_09095 [Terrimonas sp.]|uniref:glycosyltransferase n=1 Tax=Terrimonas sp. TaxID=1914338 RepID=UPI000D51C9C0|nr:glycosyltransferase [Terrimonas sp.]PVD52659.1 hypothetical protein DC498_09095 [Terrimonas sp.]